MCVCVCPAGCVLGEMLLGRPLFAGETSVDQLVKIIQTMGTPTREQMQVPVGGVGPCHDGHHDIPHTVLCCAALWCLVVR